VFLDDIGYVQHDRDEMEVLFTFLAERYERRSVAILNSVESKVKVFNTRFSTVGVDWQVAITAMHSQVAELNWPAG
jgi:hypothetical protein